MSILHIRLGIMVLLLGLPGLCLAEQEHFVAAQIGGAFPSNKVKLFWHDGVGGTGDIKYKKGKDRLGSSVLYNAVIGKKVYDSTYLEAEIAYAEHKFDKQTLSKTPVRDLTDFLKTKARVVTFFANLSYRLDKLQKTTAKGMKFTPYIAFGLGASLNRMGRTDNKDSDGEQEILPGAIKATFAWQVGGGLLISVRENIDVNMSYKYRDLGGIKSGKCPLLGNKPHVHGRLHTSNVLVGLSYKF